MLCKPPTQSPSSIDLLPYSCNRFTAQEKANTTVEISRGDMEAAYMKKATEDLESHTKRFQHYYDRYNNHLHSLDVSVA